MTKTRLCLLFASVLLASAGAGAQQNDLARIKPRTATLVSHFRGKDYGKSVFNFQHGVRGDKRRPAKPGTVSLKGLPDNRGVEMRGFGGSAQDVHETGNPIRTRNDIVPGARADFDSQPTERAVRYDIRFGGMMVNGDYHWLEIAERRGAQSVVKDLGAMSWDEVTHVPLLPASPEPYTGAIVHTRRGITAPENVVVRAAAGHMYLLHVKDQRTEYYVMFRVESLDPNGECTLSWKRVPSPKS